MHRAQAACKEHQALLRRCDLTRNVQTITARPARPATECNLFIIALVMFYLARVHATNINRFTFSTTITITKRAA